MEGSLYRKMEDNEYILLIMDQLNNMCNLVENNKGLVSDIIHNKANNLFDDLNSYWHGRDG